MTTMLRPAQLARIRASCNPIYERVGADGTIVALDLAAVKTNAQRWLAAWRWQRSVAGFTAPDGTFVATDETTRAVVDQTISLIDLGIKTQPFSYKTPAGWRDVTRADLFALAGVMSDYVQSCFDAERSIGAAIDAAETIEQVRAALTAAA